MDSTLHKIQDVVKNKAAHYLLSHSETRSAEVYKKKVCGLFNSDNLLQQLLNILVITAVIPPP